MKVAFVFVALLGMTLAVSDIRPGADITQCKAQDLECPVFKLLAVHDVSVPGVLSFAKADPLRPGQLEIVIM